MICNRNHPDPRKLYCILTVPPLPAATSLPALAGASAKFNNCMSDSIILHCCSAVSRDDYTLVQASGNL